MNFLGSNLNRYALARAVSTNVPNSGGIPSTRSGELMDAFRKLVRDYDSNGHPPNLSPLVCECMKHGEVGALGEILAFEAMRSLYIRGPIDAQGWQTFVDAMPGSLPVAVLSLSNLAFDSLTVELLFQALRKMPALVNLFLHGIEAEAGVMDAPECPTLEQLKTLNVVEAEARSGGKLSVCPLLIKILEGCKVRNLSIRGLRFEVPGKGDRKLGGPVVTVDQNAALGVALCRQSELQVLRIKECRALVHFQDMGDEKNPGHHLIQITSVCKMPSLRLLDLSGNHLPGRTTALILAALEQEETGLRHLNLNDNFIPHDTVTAMASLLRKNSTLTSVSFEDAKDRDVNGNEDERPVDEGDLVQLTAAMEHNTSLRRLSFKVVPGLDCSAILDYLQRNTQSFRASYLQGGMRAVLNSEDHKFPNDLVTWFSEEAEGYLTEHEALNLSSVNKEAWLARQDFF